MKGVLDKSQEIEQVDTKVILHFLLETLASIIVVNFLYKKCSFLPHSTFFVCGDRNIVGHQM